MPARTCSAADEVNSILPLFCMCEALAAEKPKSSAGLVLPSGGLLDGAELC